MDPKVENLVTLLKEENVVIDSITIFQGTYKIIVTAPLTLIETIKEKCYSKIQISTSGDDKQEIYLPVAFDVPLLDSIHKSQNWDMVDEDREIDRKLATEYLDSITDRKLQWVTNQIMDNTEYINFNRFKARLVHLLDLLPPKFNLFLDSHKLGSEIFCTMLVWPFIRTRVIKVINRYYDLDNEAPLVMFDDAMYTGTNVACLIGSFNREYNEWKLPDLVLESVNIGSHTTVINHALKNEIIIVSPFVNSQADCKITAFREMAKLDLKLFTTCITKPMAEIIMETKGRRKYGFNSVVQVVKYLASNFDTVVGVAMYFDHKIANKHGSFPCIYEKILKCLPSREKIEELENLLTRV
jgi:hypothetical protein